MENKKLKKKLVLKQKVKALVTKTMLTIIVFLIGMIILKENPSTKKLIEKNLYEKSLKFTKMRQAYDKYFGDIFSMEKIIYEEKPVFSEKIAYTKITKYKDGGALSVSENYMVPAIESGIVVYIGNKAEYGQTLVIEQTNGIDVFYSNITTDNIKLYDYIEKGSYIGNVKSKKLYLVFQKDACEFLSRTERWKIVEKQESDCLSSPSSYMALVNYSEFIFL